MKLRTLPTLPGLNSRFRSPPTRLSETFSAEACLDVVEVEKACDQERRGLSGLQKAGLAGLATLSAVSALTGAAGLAARRLPVCEAGSGLVSIQSDQLCVSPDLSTNFDALYRGVRGRFHQDEAIKDLASGSNRVLQPASPTTRTPDGEFTINSWNLHHGTSQNKTGARNQLDIQIDKLRESDADVDLLQEVLPWHAQRIVDGTGKVGYYSQTTPRQGNLILVSPEMVVTQNARYTLNHDVANVEQAGRVVSLKSGEEPRAAQFLHLHGADTNGKELAVFNTHLSTGSASAQSRADEHQVLESLVDKHRFQADMLVGGGDLNTREGEEIVAGLQGKGLRVEGARIDWLVSDTQGASDVRRVDVRTTSGTYVSDHPLVEGSYQF